VHIVSMRPLSMALLLSIAACTPKHTQTANTTSITSRTAITGSVNREVLEGSISAVIDTDRGGESTCTFLKLPTRFNPATLNTFT
jgi:hypothetical protein